MDILSTLNQIPPAVLSAVSFLAATIASAFIAYMRDKKLQAKVANLQRNNDLNKELLARQTSAIEIALSQQQHSQRLTKEHQIEAADKAWKEVLVLRNLLSNCTTIDDITQPSERTRDCLVKISGMTEGDAAEKIRYYLKHDTLEELRPYLGEQLWMEFYALRAFTLRCLHCYEQNLTMKSPVIWSDDAGLQQILLWVMKDEDKAAKLFTMQHGFVRASQEELEAMVYRSLTRILTGEIASAESMKTLSELQKIESGIGFPPSLKASSWETGLTIEA